MWSPLFSLLFCGLVLLPSPAASQSRTNAPADTDPPGPLLIVGGPESDPSASPTDSTVIPHWVVLGAPHRDGENAFGSPSIAQCGGTSVTFARETPSAVKDLPTTTVRGAIVTEPQLTAWGASEALLRRLRDTDVRLKVDPDAPSRPTRYCVAAAVLPLADTDAKQRAVARIERDTTAGLTARSLAVVEKGTYSGGGTYLFEEIKRKQVERPRMVIVGRSSVKTFGFTGTKARGSFAVLLGRWDPAAATVVSPSARECASTQVEFRLLVPAEAGTSVPKAPVRAFMVDPTFGKQLFPDSYDENDHPSRRAGVLENGAMHFCVAQSPVRLATTVGYQQVVAQVKRDSWASPDLAIKEARQVSRANSAAAASYFDPIRVHDRARPFVGGLYLPWGFNRQSDDSTETVNIMPMAGFDFPLETFFRVPTSLRIVLATELSDNFGEQIHVGLSWQSAFGGTPFLRGTQGTESTVDFSLGVSLRTEENFRVFGPSVGVLLDVRGTLDILKGAFGLS